MGGVIPHGHGMEGHRHRERASAEPCLQLQCFQRNCELGPKRRRSAIVLQEEIDPSNHHLNQDLPEADPTKGRMAVLSAAAFNILVDTKIGQQAAVQFP